MSELPFSRGSGDFLTISNGKFTPPKTAPKSARCRGITHPSPTPTYKNHDIAKECVMNVLGLKYNIYSKGPSNTMQKGLKYMKNGFLDQNTCFLRNFSKGNFGYLLPLDRNWFVKQN